jgi:hypothetical protein
MAHLWILTVEGWAVAALEGSAWALSKGATHGECPRLQSNQPGAEPPGTGVGLRCLPGDSPVWLLLATLDDGVRVNGEELALGIRVLRDHDEIRLRGQAPVYFSTEARARVERFPGAERAANCPRCRQTLEPGAEAVKCPRCGIWHHQDAERPCWVYAPSCALCDQATSLESGYEWTPEET